MKNLKHSDSVGSPGSPGNPTRPKPSKDKVLREKEKMNKFMKDNELYKIGGPRLLDKKSPLSKLLQKLTPKKSGAGYSGD